MSFIKETTKVIYGLLVAAAIGLLAYLFFVLPSTSGNPRLFKGIRLIDAQSDVSTLNFIRGFLIFGEAIWLGVWAIFYFRFATKGGAEEHPRAKENLERFEVKYFWMAAGILLFLLISSIAVPAIFAGFSPSGILANNNRHYHSGANEDFDIEIKVRSSAFIFEFDQGSGYNTVLENITTGKRYRFTITSVDVSHGFGLYSPDNELLGQTNVNPSIEVYFYFQFGEAGQYTILCMEYCGLSHHNMKTTFTVSSV